jgi:hypothetical protein
MVRNLILAWSTVRKYNEVYKIFVLTIILNCQFCHIITQALIVSFRGFQSPGLLIGANELKTYIYDQNNLPRK